MQETSMCHVLALVSHTGGARVSGQQLPNVGKIAAGKRRMLAANYDQLVLTGVVVGISD
jgi:hypothetical protein